MKLETQIVVLLLLSISALGLHHFFPRCEPVDFNSGQWEISEAISRSGGTITPSSTDRGLEVDMDVVNIDPKVAKKAHIIAARIGPKKKGQLINYSWMEKVRLRAYLEGKEEQFFRFQMRERMSGFPEDKPANRKFNEFAYKLTEEPVTMTFSREQFQVPIWWVETHSIPTEHATPSFENTEWFQFATKATNDVNYKLVVEELVVVGRWIPSVTLYRSLLLMWLLVAVGVAVEKSREFHQRIKKTRERENQLELINQSLRQKTNELTQIARFDPLTGLLNRFGIRGDVDSALSLASTDSPVSLIMLDIDHFKEINDTHGHPFGDKILSELGELLMLKTSENDSIARWGGEEFLIIRCASDADQTRMWAEQLGCEIDSELNVTCSFGVYQMQADQPFKSAVSCVDQALYQAKSLGRNRVEVFCSTEPSAAGSNDEISSSPTFNK